MPNERLMASSTHPPKVHKTLLFAVPVKIPDLPGRIRIMRKDEAEYIRYLTGSKYNPEKKYTETEGVLIGRRIEEMPGLMYPNENYEKIFRKYGNGTKQTDSAVCRAVGFRRRRGPRKQRISDAAGTVPQGTAGRFHPRSAGVPGATARPQRSLPPRGSDPGGGFPYPGTRG